MSKPFIGDNVDIGEGNTIGKNVILDGNIKIGSNNYIGHNTVITGNVIINDNNYISNQNAIGDYAQHSTKKYEFDGDNYTIDEKRIEIGNRNVFREFTNIDQPTKNITRVFNNAYLMGFSYISHDTHIYDNVILTSSVQIGGHTHILQNAQVGLNSQIHPRTTIGSFAMVGMGSTITKDVPPFITAYGSPFKVKKLNKVGIERSKLFNPQSIKKIENLFNEELLKVSSDINNFLSAVKEIPEFQKYVVDFKNQASRKMINF